MESCVTQRYCSSVLVGNWFEDAFLQQTKVAEFLAKMECNDLMLARYRSTRRALLAPATLTQTPVTVASGARVVLLSPRLALSAAALPGLASAECAPRAGQPLAALPVAHAVTGNTFVLRHVDECAGDERLLRYNDEVFLVLAAAIDADQPLYVQYNPYATPGQETPFPLQLGAAPTCGARWRVLPALRPDRTRFEMEGEPVPVNSDVLINHCATNTNLAAVDDVCIRGVFGMTYSLIVKNFLDIHKCETSKNIWHIHTEIPKQLETTKRKSA